MSRTCMQTDETCIGDAHQRVVDLKVRHVRDAACLHVFECAAGMECADRSAVTVRVDRE